jgi:hypothetical protein
MDRADSCAGAFVARYDFPPWAMVSPQMVAGCIEVIVFGRRAARGV